MSKIQIMEGFDSSLQEKYYYLLIQNKDENAAMAYSLELNKSNEFELYAVARSVTCTGCRYGCNPEKVQGEGWCSGGCPSNCTKSVTILTKAFLDYF